MTIMQRGYRYWSEARAANCKVKRWFISDHEAIQLAAEIVDLAPSQSFSKVYASIKDGTTLLYHAEVVVR